MRIYYEHIKTHQSRIVNEKKLDPDVHGIVVLVILFVRLRSTSPTQCPPVDKVLFLSFRGVSLGFSCSYILRLLPARVFNRLRPAK